ncbi:MAG: ThuA domain-containing protein, partial [Planctomycetota bacterium]
MSDSHVSRRRFFMHSAHTTVGVSAGLAALRSGEPAELAVAGRAPTEGWSRRPLRVCLVSACPHYNSDQSLAVFQKYLQEKHKMKCSLVLSKKKDDLPGLENLDESDCLLLFARRMTIKGEQLERIKRYCARGGAIVGVRTASHAFQNWLEMDKEVFGGDYQGHFGNKLTEVNIVEAAKDHPILAGVKPFGSRGTLYKNPSIAKDATVLLTGTFPGQTYPVAWVGLRPMGGRCSCPAEWAGGRVFYTSLGHP